MMRVRYDTQLSSLQTRLEKADEQIRSKTDSVQLKASIRSELADLMIGKGRTEPLYQKVLEQITVFANGHVSLKLYSLPHLFWFEK